MKTTERFNEVTGKLNKMFKCTEDKKDKIVSDLKLWIKLNRNSNDKCKIDAIQNFLSENGVY